MFTCTKFFLRNERKLLKYCYSCGRSVAVKLIPCSRCKKVFYCSNTCKQKGWIDLHRNECVLSSPRKLFSNIFYVSNFLTLIIFIKIENN